MRYLKMAMVLMVGTAFGLGAQAPPAVPGGAGPVPGGRGFRGPQFDAAAVERGKTAFVAECGFCHGTNARGGQSGPDLIRSPLVMNDEKGKQLGDYLKVGSPEKGMPSFARLAPQQVSDLATFLHREIAAVANRGSYQILNILVGDAKAGEAYFREAGKCNSCHSPAGDLKGVGAKYDPVALQGRIVMPRGRGGFGRGRGAEPQGRPITVTVTFPSGGGGRRESAGGGQSHSGALVRITDFDVTLRDSSGVLRSFTRLEDDVPKVETKDPLQAHVDLLARYKDADIHNLTAYLVTLK